MELLKLKWTSSIKDSLAYVLLKADAYWLIDYRFYSPEDVIKILETLFLLLPKYDTNSMVSEMKKLAHELYIDTIDFDDDDEWDILVTV